MRRVLNKVAKMISSSIFFVLVVLIGLILAYLVYVRVLTSQNRLDEVKINFYTILTQSMYPTIKAGDIVITYKNEDNVYHVGDVITFISTSNTANGVTITHRIKEVYAVNGVYTYKTQGDANNVSDSAAVLSQNVIGRVVFKIPKAGYIQQFLVTSTGWIVAVVIPCLGIIIYDILKIFKNMAKKTTQKFVKGSTVEREHLKEVLDDEHQ